MDRFRKKSPRKVAPVRPDKHWSIWSPPETSNRSSKSSPRVKRKTRRKKKQDSEASRLPSINHNGLGETQLSPSLFRQSYGNSWDHTPSASLRSYVREIISSEYSALAKAHSESAVPRPSTTALTSRTSPGMQGISSSPRSIEHVEERPRTTDTTSRSTSHFVKAPPRMTDSMSSFRSADVLVSESDDHLTDLGAYAQKLRQVKAALRDTLACLARERQGRAREHELPTPSVEAPKRKEMDEMVRVIESQRAEIARLREMLDVSTHKCDQLMSERLDKLKVILDAQEKQAKTDQRERELSAKKAELDALGRTYAKLGQEEQDMRVQLTKLQRQLSEKREELRDENLALEVARLELQGMSGLTHASLPNVLVARELVTADMYSTLHQRMDGYANRQSKLANAYRSSVKEQRHLVEKLFQALEREHLRLQQRQEELEFRERQLHQQEESCSGLSERLHSLASRLKVAYKRSGKLVFSNQLPKEIPAEVDTIVAEIGAAVGSARSGGAMAKSRSVKFVDVPEAATHGDEQQQPSTPVEMKRSWSVQLQDIRRQIADSVSTWLEHDGHRHSP